MPAWGVLALAVGASGYVLRASLRWSFAAVVGAVILVPGALVLPNGYSTYPTVTRVVIVAFCVRVLIGVRAGEVPRGAFRLTRVHAVFWAFLLLALVNGTALAAATTSPNFALRLWVDLVDQFVFLTFVLAALRAIDDTSWAFKVVAAAIAISGVIAVGEHFTGSSYARWFYANLPNQRLALNAQVLEHRGSALRARGASEFALEFAWVSTFFLPIVTVVAARSRRPLAWAMPGVVLLAIIWSYSRSVFAGVAVGGFILLVGSPVDRRVVRAVVTVALAFGLGYVLVPRARQPFTSASARGSVLVREERLPKIMKTLVPRAYHGVGLGGLEPLGFGVTDSSYLLLYAELGVVGLAAAAVLLLTAIAACLPGLRAPPGIDRSHAAAVVGGAVGAIIGAAAFDLLAVPGAARAFWLLIALGIALSERVPSSSVFVPARPSPTRVLLPVSALAVGMLLRATVPTHATIIERVDTLPVSRVAEGGSDQLFIGGIFLRTHCGIAHRAIVRFPDVQLKCRDIGSGPGFGEMRIQADRTARATAAADEINRTVARNEPDARIYQVGGVDVARPTWARTAPAWLSVVGLAAAVLIPPRRIRRSGQPELAVVLLR